MIAGAVLLFAGAAAAVRAPWAGVHADARREEHRDGGQADSEHVAFAIAGHATRQRERLSRFPQVAFVFSRIGTPDLAADPMPPNASDTYIILKPRDEWPDPDLSKDDLIRQLEAEASKLPGNKIGFSQPIQMRFNELIAGVREDLAVKVFGDEFAPDAARGRSDRRHSCAASKARPTSRSSR